MSFYMNSVYKCVKHAFPNIHIHSYRMLIDCLHKSKNIISFASYIILKIRKIKRDSAYPFIWCFLQLLCNSVNLNFKMFVKPTFLI